MEKLIKSIRKAVKKERRVADKGKRRMEGESR